MISPFPIVSDPEVLGGTMVFRATRVPAQSLLDYLQDGYTLDDFLSMFPTVQRNYAIAFLEFVQTRPHPADPDGAIVVGCRDRLAFRIHPCSECLAVREVDIFVNGLKLPLRDNHVYVPFFAGNLQSVATYLQSRINWNQPRWDFGDRNVAEIHEFLRLDENENLRKSLRFMDWGETTDDVISFLIPYADSLYLTYQIRAQHLDETADRGIRWDYSCVDGVRVSLYELICTLENAASILLRDWRPANEELQ